MKLVTQRAYAAMRKVSPQYISKLCKEGVLTLQAGKVDPVQADKAIEDWSARIHDAPGVKGSSEVNDDSIAAHRKKQIKVVTALKQLQLSEEEGLLVNAEDLKTELARLFVDIKTLLRQVPSKTAGEIYHLAKIAKTDREGMASISTLLLAEIDEVLTQLSRWQQTSTKKGGDKGRKKGPYRRR